MISAGIDAGSRTLKVVLWDADARRVLAQGLTDQGLDQSARLERLQADLLCEANVMPEHLANTVATGYGRNAVAAAQTTVTEITCHARGVRHVAPDARTIIDIGGEDSKLIRLDDRGHVQDFAMNDRCAAGTGRFLEIVARRLEVELDDLGALAATSEAPARISSMCVLFAETEIIGLLAGGCRREDIVAGIQNAIAARVGALAGGRITPPVVFTGGGARVSGMREALAQTLQTPIQTCPEPQMTGALGAAILAARPS
jgi:predicted CoA-substrate-specific enzyme activase